jgi:hypothetical protein
MLSHFLNIQNRLPTISKMVFHIVPIFTHILPHWMDYKMNHTWKTPQHFKHIHDSISWPNFHSGITVYAMVTLPINSTEFFMQFQVQKHKFLNDSHISTVACSSYNQRQETTTDFTLQWLQIGIHSVRKHLTAQYFCLCKGHTGGCSLTFTIMDSTCQQPNICSYSTQTDVIFLESSMGAQC